MDLFYGGCEQPGWRTLLQREGVTTVSLSWYGLKRRKNPRDFLIRDNFEEGTRVFLDSGAYSVNKDTEVTQDQAYDLAQDYMDFVDRNIDSIAFAAEFDALALGRDLLNDFRREYWENLPADKWMAIWHSEWGSNELRRMAGEYHRVGILQSDGKSQDVKNLLRSLSRDTKFHGVSMTKMEIMRDLPLDSVGSTSWLSPTQFGDTFIWDGHQLHRYPRDYKEQGRTQHRRWMQSQGFDTDKIDADDNGELLRLSIWSWQKFTASLADREVTPLVIDPFGQNAETPLDEVDTPGPAPQNSLTLVPRERTLLPVLQTVTHTSYEADGTEVESQILRTPTSNLLQCDTCYIASRCPKMQPGAECAYEIPVEIRTSTQLAALQDTLIEMQTQRLLRMTMIEQVEGGHTDSATDQQFDRLQRMIKNKLENGKERTPLIQMNVGGGGGPGMISRIFGSDTNDRVNALPAAMDSESIMDAVLVDE